MSGKRYLSDQFLIASPGLQDPNFARGVTLICQHDEDGAMGLTEVPIPELRADLKAIIEEQK